jgi:hypothetical protein
MAITATCPGCGQTLSVDDQYTGMQGKCPTCNTVLTFPSTPAAAPPPIPASAPAAPAPASPAAYEPFGAAPSPPAPGLALDENALTLIGLGAAAFFYLLLLISPLLGWAATHQGVTGSVLGVQVVFERVVSTGTRFGDGRLLFCLTLVILILIGLNFLNRSYLAPTMVLGGAFATFALLMMMGRVGAGGAGVWLGLVASVGAAAACLWLAVRQPFQLQSSLLARQPSFFRTYGALMGAEAVALVLGVFYCLLRALFAGV